MTTLPPPGIDAAAYAFAVKHSRPLRKTGQAEVAENLKGLNGQSFVEVARFWLQESGRPNLTKWDVSTICDWLRAGYYVEDVLRAIQRAKETGKPLLTCNFVQPHLLAVAEQYKEARVGRGPR